MLFRSLTLSVVFAFAVIGDPAIAAKSRSGSGSCPMGASGCKSLAPLPALLQQLAEPSTAPACSILGTWTSAEGIINFNNDGTGTYRLPPFCTGTFHATYFPNGDAFTINVTWAGGQSCVSSTGQWSFNQGCTTATVPYQNASGTSGTDFFTRSFIPIVATPTTIDLAATGPSDHIPVGGAAAASGGACPAGCATWSVAPLTVSLGLHDIPLSYRPPRGPPIEFHLYYSHRDNQQPSSLAYGNFGRQWTTNWLSFVTDEIATRGTAKLYQRGGGGETYGFGNASGVTSQIAPYSQAILTRTLAANGTTLSFTRQMKDGSTEEFNRKSGTRFFMTAVVDPQGNRVTLSYDSLNRLTSLTDAIGQVTTLAYQSVDVLKITKITDPFGRAATFTYSSGRLASITDTIGLASRFTYGPGNFVNSLSTPYGQTKFEFADASTNPALGTRRLLQVTDPLGQISLIEYRHDAPGIAQTDPVAPVGVEVSNTQLHQRNTYIWDPVQLEQAFVGGVLDYTKARVIHWLRSTETDTVSRVIESTKEPLEGRVWYRYPGQPDAMTVGTRNLPSQVARVLDDGETQLYAFTYNDIGMPATTTDPIGRQTTYSYDDTGIDLLAVANTTNGDDQALSSFTYNEQHLPLTITDAAGRSTSFTYNSNGQVLSTTDALGNSTKYEYDDRGFLKRIVNPNDRTALAFIYDTSGRVASRTDSEGHTTTFAYDDFDRLIKTTFPDGTFYRNDWDKLDLAATTDRENRKTSYAYDANRRLLSSVNPLGHTTSYEYYGNGALKRLTDPKGNITNWDIDLQGRVTAKIYPDGSKDRTTYEASVTRIKSLTDALDQTRTFTYALDDRRIGIGYSNAAATTPNVTFTYDANFPRLISMQDGSGTTVYQYRPVGSLGALQLAGEDGPFQNDAITYQYDALGRVTSRKVDVATETFIYDALGRVTTHASPLGTFRRTYLGQTEQLTRQRIANGAVETNWAYDANLNDRRLKSILNNGATRSFRYSTSPQSLITRIQETTGIGGAFTAQTWNYSYDAAERLLNAQAVGSPPFAYTLDPADNILAEQSPAGTKTTSYNALNQIVQSGAQPFSYDHAGNLESDGQRTYKWDAEGRLVEIGYKAQPVRRTQFRHDGLGRRTAIIEINGASRAETRYLWCGSQICQARSANDVVSRRYFEEGEVWPAAGSALYYARDHLGSVRDVLVAQTGARVASYDYDPYGSPSRASGRVSVVFRYAGMLYHQASGLYLTQYRAYDPKSARWLSRDPIEEAGDSNLYAYVGNPINLVDTRGLAAECPQNVEDIRTCNRNNDAVFVPYGGRTEMYHCGGEVYMEVWDGKSSVAECAYDMTGGLIDDFHPYRYCKGTADLYPYYGGTKNAIGHMFKDPGGPNAKLNSGETLGQAARRESARYASDLKENREYVNTLLRAYHHGLLPKPQYSQIPLPE